MENITRQHIQAFEKLGYIVKKTKLNNNIIIYARNNIFRHTWLNGHYLETCIKLKGKWENRPLFFNNNTP